MNRITFPRNSYSGEVINREDLESWFCGRIEAEISAGLRNIPTPRQCNQKRLLKFTRRNLHSILLCSPQRAARLADIIDRQFPRCFQRKPRRGRMVSTKFGKDILDAFNYNKYRKTVLLELAEKLNVKSCPYCNMHYTLFAETDDPKKDKIAKLQFDHFFGKAEYPLLSMSLYNLIPSCGVCNQGKSSKNLSLRFHPYASSIKDQFHFEADESLLLYLGGKPDIIEIKMESDGPSPDELRQYQEMFHLRSLYRRHKDIVQEIFDKEYLNRYYSESANFPFAGRIDSDYLTRLWMGTYPDEDDMDKRPMSKFIHDILRQAKALLGKRP